MENQIDESVAVEIKFLERRRDALNKEIETIKRAHSNKDLKTLAALKVISPNVAFTENNG